MAQSPVNIMQVINKLGQVNHGKTSQETHTIVKQIVKCMTEGNAKWPDSDLCKMVYNLTKREKTMFLDIMKQMDKDLIEAFSIAAKVK